MKDEVKQVTKEAFEAFNRFINLSKTLFAHNGKNYDAGLINELITKDSPFYKDAVAIAKECGMNWDKLSAEDSDELQLILLDDYYNRIRVSKKFKYDLSIHVEQLEGGE